MDDRPRMPPFRNDAQRECYARVRDIVHAAFGEHVAVDDARPSFTVRRGSTAVQITVYAWAGDAVVHSRAMVVRGAQRDADLYELLLRQNAKVVYGAFAIDVDGDIVFIHATPAVAITPEGLQRQIDAMLDVADHLDDFIKGQWGGDRTIDQS